MIKNKKKILIRTNGNFLSKTKNQFRLILVFILYFSYRSRDDKNLTLYSEKYDGGTVENAPLIIKNVTREDMGHYTCMCTNNVGSERSETSIFVNVLCEYAKKNVCNIHVTYFILYPLRNTYVLIYYDKTKVYTLSVYVRM